MSADKSGLDRFMAWNSGKASACAPFANPRDLTQAAVAAALEGARRAALKLAHDGDHSVANAIRALITNPQRDAMQAVIDAAKAEARAEDAVDSFATLIADARAEAERAMAKFPQPNYVISKFAEEAGEVVKAAIHCAENRETAENVRGEMKQAIAMLYRLWVEGDDVHGLKPLAQIGAKP